MDGSVILTAERMWNIAALGNVGKCRTVNEDAAVLIDLETGWTAWDDNLQAALTSPNVVFGVFDGTGSADPKMAASHCSTSASALNERR